VSGEVLYAPLLASHVDADIPVYGLAETPLGKPPLQTIHARAKRFVRIIRAVQPVGPYRVAGWSLGGNVAYEIAIQLLGEDEIVDFLGLIDSVNFAGTCPKEQPPTDDKTLLMDIVRHTVAKTDSSLQRRLKTLPKTGDLETFARTCRINGLLPPDMSLGDIKDYLVRMKASTHALYDYQPPSIPIPVHLFRAMDEKAGAPPGRDTHLGWAQVLPKTRIRVISVPGTHYSMMYPPQIEVLGRSLTDAIR